LKHGVDAYIFHSISRPYDTTFLIADKQFMRHGDRDRMRKTMH